MRGQAKGPIINARVEEERQKLIKAAKKKPIKMFIDCPDPHGKSFTHSHKVIAFLIVTNFSGNGGSTDTANTARRFLGVKRDQILEIVKVSNLQIIQKSYMYFHQH